jgi:hypothetical protein
MEVIPLDASLVKGSHGRAAGPAEEGPLFMTKRTDLLEADRIDATQVHDLILRSLS